MTLFSEFEELHYKYTVAKEDLNESQKDLLAFLYPVCKELAIASDEIYYALHEKDGSITVDKNTVTIVAYSCTREIPLHIFKSDNPVKAAKLFYAEKRVREASENLKNIEAAAARAKSDIEFYTGRLKNNED